MKIIDENGKLFGKINIIDFFALLLLVFLVLAAYSGYNVFNKRTTLNEKSPVFMPMDMYIVFKDLDPKLLELISAGDTELDIKGMTLAQIMNIYKVENNFIEFKLSEEDVFAKEDALRRQITAKVMLLTTLDGNSVIYKGSPVKFGTAVTFKTKKYVINGIIIPEPFYTTHSPDPNFNYVTLDVLFENLNPEIANLISVGDFEIDRDGYTIAKVLSIGSPEPYSYRMDMGSGKYIDKTDTEKRQLRAKMEIRGAIEEGNNFYFKGKRIALDSRVGFNTNRYQIKGLVIKEPIAMTKIDKRWILLKVKFVNLSPEVVGIIKAGDKGFDPVSGDVILRVDSVVSSIPSKNFNLKLDENNELVVYAGALASDVVLWLRVFCIKNQQGVVFKEKTLKINKEFVLETDKYQVSGKIIEMQGMNGDGKD